MEKNNNSKKRDFKVDTLNDELYYKNISHEQRKRRKIHGRKIRLDHDFKDENYEKRLEKNKKRKLPTSLFRKVFFGALFIFIITAIVAALSLYEKKESVSKELISMEVIGQPFVDGGENLELRIRIQNFNKQKLILPDLVLSYPKDSSSKEDDVFKRRSLPDIDFNQKIDEKFNLTLFGKEGDVRKIHAKLEYRIEGSTSVFFKDIDHELIIRSTPTQISIKGPEEAIQGQEIQLDIHFSANSNKPINNMLMSVDYPLGFEFISSNKDPQFGNHSWSFADVLNKDNLITIVGKLSALPGQGQSFHVKMGKQDVLQKNYIETVFNEVTHTVDIKEAFIKTELKINGMDENRSVIRGGGDADVNIEFTNTLDRKLNNVELVAHLVGDLYKPAKVRALKGDYNSNEKTITWNKDTVDMLSSLDPGQSGYVTLNIQTKDLVGAKGAFTKPNFGIVLDLLAVDINGEIKEAKSISRVDVVANSDLVLLAKTLYSDGPFKNKGPIPPRVGKKTRYTLTFQVTNSSNEVKNVNVNTFLPPYVDWVGDISPSIEKNNISYNKTTREITWNIGTLRPGIGIGVSRPKEVSFQVDVLPSLSHVDTLPSLTRDIIISGDDTFTGTKLRYKKTNLTTRLLESSASTGDSRVIE